MGNFSKKAISLLLTAVMCLGALPAALADETAAGAEPAPAEPPSSETAEQPKEAEAAEDPVLFDVPEILEEAELFEEPELPEAFEPVWYAPAAYAGLPDNETLFAGYARRILEDGYVAVGGHSAGENLTGNDRMLYEWIKAAAIQVAAGERDLAAASMVPAESIGMKLEYTARELGYEEICTDMAVEVRRLVTTYDPYRITNALMADCPFECYWYDKLKSFSITIHPYTFIWNNEDQTITLKAYCSFQLRVAEAYLGQPVGEDDAFAASRMNTDIPQSVFRAKANARAIVARYAGLSDYEKLRGLCDSLCAMTDYDYAAARDPNAPYGDPWQLIWALDGDPETKVVCEGYAKAFQYLCDLTEFTSGVIVCRSVQGGLDGGPHMWNIVRMDDGKNYLVDVTNSDWGDSSSFRVFLKGYTAKASDRNFTVSYMTYEYNYNTTSVYTDDELILPPADYVPPDIRADGATGVAVHGRGALAGDVTLVVTETTVADAVVMAGLSADAVKTRAFDIALRKNGAAVQPGGPVQVRIPLPRGFLPGVCGVYRLEGHTLTDMNAVPDGRDMVFTADHFSTYIVAQSIPLFRDRVTGDVNGDDAVTLADAQMAVQHIVGLLVLVPEERMTADINGDDTIDLADALRLARTVLTRAG